MSSLVDFCELRTLNGLCPGLYEWIISDSVNQGVITNGEVVNFVGSGGTTCTWNNATQTMTINGAGAGSEWYVKGDTSADPGGDVKNLDIVEFLSAGQTGGGAPYPDDGVLVSQVSTVVGPPDTFSLTFKLNKSVSIIGDSFTNGLLRIDGTGLPQPAANEITIGPQDSLLIPGTTILATQLGTVGWEIASSNDIDFIDGGNNSFMEIDASADRLTLAKQTAGAITLPTAISIQTRQIWYEATVGQDLQISLLAPTSQSRYINFGNSGGENNSGQMLWTDGTSTVSFGPIRPSCSANIRLQSTDSGGAVQAPWLSQRLTAASTGTVAGYADTIRCETLQNEGGSTGKPTVIVDKCTPFWITYSTMTQVPAQNLNQTVAVNMEWANGTAGCPYNGAIAIPATTATNNPIGDFSSCCVRCFNDQIMPTGGGEVFQIGSRFMAMETGTGAYRIEMIYRIYNRTGTGTEPCVDFQLYTAVNAAVPIWIQANKVHTQVVHESVAPVGRSTWQSGCAVWYCGFNHGNGFKIMAVRTQYATSTDPVYVDAESTTCAITKLG